MKRITALLVIFALTPLVIPFQSTSYTQEHPPTCNWEVYFSPHGGCTDAIIRELNKAKSTVLVEAYSFTSTPVAKALLNAHKRGVKVEVILDKRYFWICRGFAKEQPGRCGHGQAKNSGHNNEK